MPSTWHVNDDVIPCHRYMALYCFGFLLMSRWGKGKGILEGVEKGLKGEGE
jgi:hypothetical protein